MNVDKSEQRIQRMFGSIAHRYDFLNHFLSGGIDYYWRWRTVKKVAPRGIEPILDVCTGTGDLAIAYWKAGIGRIPIVASDFTHEMLVLANKKKPSAATGSAPLEFLEADTQHLPFPDDMFQIVSVAFGLRNVTDTRRGLEEMIRVCRPGGRVAVLEFSKPRNPVLGGIYGWYFTRVLPRIGQFFARNADAAYNYLPSSVAEFPCGEELTAIMTDCGLEQVSWKSFTLGIAALYIGTKPESKTSNAAATEKQAVPTSPTSLPITE